MQGRKRLTTRRTIQNSLFVLLIGATILPIQSLNNLFTQRSPNSNRNKCNFLNGLDTLNGINSATPERTALLQEMITDPTVSSFPAVAAGTWTVLYAPHITTMARVLGNSAFDPILYQMHADGTMTSHVRWTFLERFSCWLSVSGTYASQDDDRVSRVSFDQVWMKWNACLEDGPYPTLQDVPASWWKTIVQTMGQLGFVESFSVFPVAYLDNDLIVFDFKLLGTRICARKLPRNDLY
ncbi:hypothetical protein FisN_21Hu218 [Fistulifera solaris]|uniref:Plastid lipid-associated protein/fibrillin conserved domain-containing protein n=1 Tax=Fistulifera solaris TaxID=1519565 RepID=A0A1Z5JRW9_FISSO|nr:hypothetical protein FisN_21Hu218 [Fistulifera solaris]|eukprot:GAX16770.1 hypothetical protein FisN_21Hu218 [Fistulifera solaris]